MVAAVAVLVAGCQLPVVLGGFGVFATGPGPTPAPDGRTGSDTIGAGPNVVEQTAGGANRGGISVSGRVRLDDRGDHSGITVALVRGTATVSLQTSASGQFRFKDLAAGDYELSAARTDYDTATAAVRLDQSDQVLADLVLSSPPAKVALAPATDSAFVAPADAGAVPLQPTTVRIVATVTKKNGLEAPGTPANLSWEATPSTQATVDWEGPGSPAGLVRAAATSQAGSVEIVARVKGKSGASASVKIKLLAAEGLADVQLLSLPGSRVR